MDAKDVIEGLLSVLPDSIHTEHETRCWDWCWDELDNEAQEEVKKYRKYAELFLQDWKEISDD